MKHLSFSLVSIYSLNMAYKFYLKNDLDLSELYKTCHFCLEDMQEVNAHITIETLIKSLKLIKSHLKGGVSLSYELEKQLDFSDFGAFGFTLLAAPSLKEGLDLLVYGFSTMDPSFEFKYEKNDSDSIKFTIENPGYFKDFNEDILDLANLMLKKYIKNFTANIDLSKMNNKQINFSYSEKNKRITIINKALLLLPSKMSHIAFFKSNKKKFIKRSNQEKHLKGCVLSVNKIIRNNVKKGYKPCLNDIAGQLGTTPKTLSRLLKAHNTSFQACLDQVVCDLAINLIQEEYNTKEIAYSLGFQSIAGLNYLFIKKYGLTLNQLKESLNLSHNHTACRP